MPAFRAERVALRTDCTRQNAVARAGEKGWTIPGDNGGLAANYDWYAVLLDNGARVEVRTRDLEVLPWPALGWPLTG